jgi:hypothetical protein
MFPPLKRKIGSMSAVLVLLICLLSLGIPVAQVSTNANSAQAIASTNPIEDAKVFVRQQYLDFLSRNPDPAGLAFWTNQITACGTNASCIADRRINVSAAFFISIEFQQTGYLVHRLYRASYGRLPALGEFMPDTQGIGRGVIVNATGWEQLLESNKVAFLKAFVARQSFKDVYNSRTNLDYINTLFANAGVTPTTTERDTLVARLNSGAETRADTLRKIAEHPTFYRQEYNRAFVLMQYFGYLRRNANDSPDVDFSGLNFWLNKVNQFSLPGEDVTDSNVALNRVRRAEMVKAFIISGEYRGRFVPKVGTRFTLFSNRNDPLLLRAEPPTGEVLEYYGEKNDLGVATSVKSFRIQAANGQATSYLLDQQARPVQIYASNGVVFKLSWQANQVIVITAISPNGATQVNASVKMVGSSTNGLPQLSETTASRETISRFYRAFEPNPLAESEPSGVLLPTATAPSSSLVTVKRCGLPVNDARVSISVSAGVQSGSFPGVLVGDGVYRVSLPSFDSDAGSRAKEKCETIAGILGVGCQALEILGPAQPLFCPALSVALAFIPGAEPAIPAIFDACISAFASLEVYCSTLGASPAQGAPDLAELICGAGSIIDRAPTTPVQLSAVALIPGKGVAESNSATAPASGPFPNFTIAPTDSVSITSFTVNPVNPAAGQSYTATAQIGCASQNTKVTISISGTDGYQNSTLCTVTGSATCSLGVPGAASGVVDTLTVKIDGGPTRTIVNVFR